MIAQETIDNVVETANILEVVGMYVNLQKKGTVWKGNCPFHGEKTPSFAVSANKGIYKCFGCGKGGDSVRFIMEHEKYSYPEAIKFLATKYSIEFLEVGIDDKEREIQMARESVLSLNEFSAERFMANVLKFPEASRYIAGRNISEETAKKFMIGYGAPGYRDLNDYLVSKKYAQDLILKANLSYKNDNNQIIDRYRDRIIFPIQNVSGRVVGFGGRIMGNDKSKSKYVNSTESDIYHKSSTLYGLFHAKKSISDLDHCLLGEGYLDVVSVVQGGIENIVASSGTALTVEQIKLIKRWTNNITFLFDGDAAGIKAAFKGMELVISEGMRPRIVTFDKGDDPDSFINSKGSAALRKYIEDNRLDVIEYCFRGWDKLSPEAKDEAGQLVLRLIAKIPTDGIEGVHIINDYVEKFAKVYGAPIGQIHIRVEQIRRKSETAANKGFKAEPEEELPIPPAPDPQVFQHEMEFVRILVVYGNKQYFNDMLCYYYMLERCGKPEDFKNPVARKIFIAYYNELLNNNIPDIDFFLHHLDEDIKNFADDIILGDDHSSALFDESVGKLPDQDPIQIAKNVTSWLRVYKFKELLANIKDQILNTDDQALFSELNSRYKNVKKNLGEECKELGISIVL